MGHDDPGEDATLVRRIAGGDARAEAELAVRLLPRVRAYGLRHLRDRTTAADLAQHVVVAVIEAIRAGRVEQPERLAAFVLGTCRNTVQSQRIGERRRRDLLERFGEDFAGVAEIGEHALDLRRLAGCLERLELRARSVVVMSYYAELECEAIGRELAMTAGNVRVVRHRALRQLHDCVTGAPP